MEASSGSQSGLSGAGLGNVTFQGISKPTAPSARWVKLKLTQGFWSQTLVRSMFLRLFLPSFLLQHLKEKTDDWDCEMLKRWVIHLHDHNSCGVAQWKFTLVACCILEPSTRNQCVFCNQSSGFLRQQCLEVQMLCQTSLSALCRLFLIGWSRFDTDLHAGDSLPGHKLQTATWSLNHSPLGTSVNVFLEMNVQDWCHGDQSAERPWHLCPYPDDQCASASLGPSQALADTAVLGRGWCNYRTPLPSDTMSTTLGT